MYNGSNKTALTSQRQIADAMLHLLKEKSFCSISVCEICKEANVSRQTFYSLFRSKENVISYELGRNYCFRLKGECRKTPFSLEMLSKLYANYIEEQKAFISILVENQILQLMQKSIRDSFLSCVSDRNMDLTAVYEADFIAAGISSIARNYVLSGPDADVSFLEHMIFRLFSGTFFESQTSIPRLS